MYADDSAMPIEREKRGEHPSRPLSNEGIHSVSGHFCHARSTGNYGEWVAPSAEATDRLSKGLCASAKRCPKTTSEQVISLLPMVARNNLFFFYAACIKTAAYREVSLQREIKKAKMPVAFSLSFKRFRSARTIPFPYVAQL